MSLQADLKDIFDELDYQDLKSFNNLENISLVDFSRIVNWISLQLQFFAKTDSIVNTIKDENDIDSLRIELNSLFKEVGSIYSDSFTADTVTQRLNILHSLAGDLLVARINYVKNIDENSEFSNELNPKKDLNIINSVLSVSEDLKDIKIYFQTVKEKLNKNLINLHEEDSLLVPVDKSLAPNQWTELKKLNEKLRNEYSIRRDMLLRRADATVNSFCWKKDDPKAIDTDVIQNVYNKSRQKLSSVPMITLSHALAARNSDCNSLINDVISTTHANCIIDVPTYGKANQGAQQKLQLHKYLIGSVPDRGGRPQEQPTPVKENFQHQQQQREHFQQRGRGGGGGGNRGNNRTNDRPNFQRNIPEQTNRVQNAGWQGGSDYKQQNYQGGGGGGGRYQQQPNRSQYQDNYDQYQGGYQRFGGYDNGRQGYQQNNEYANRRGGGGGHRGRGHYRGGGNNYNNSNY